MEEGTSELQKRSFEMIHPGREVTKEKGYRRVKSACETLLKECVTEITEAEKKKGTESLITAENLPNLGTEMDSQIHESQGIPNRLNLKGPTLRHIIMKLSKVKDTKSSLKSAREKQLT